jgi:hypothetical protein
VVSIGAALSDARATTKAIVLIAEFGAATGTSGGIADLAGAETHSLSLI